MMMPYKTLTTHISSSPSGLPGTPLAPAGTISARSARIILRVVETIHAAPVGQGAHPEQGVWAARVVPKGFERGTRA